MGYRRHGDAIHTSDNNPTVQKARAQGKRVLDLRDDGKWHDMSVPKSSGAGKGPDRRPQSVSDEEFARRWAKTFGGDDEAQERPS